MKSRLAIDRTCFHLRFVSKQVEKETSAVSTVTEASTRTINRPGRRSEVQNHFIRINGVIAFIEATMPGACNAAEFPCDLQEQSG